MECLKCVSVWLGAVYEVRGEWMRGLGLGFTNPVVTGGVLVVCWVPVVWVVQVGVVRGLDQGFEGWGSVMYVCVGNLDYLCRWQVQIYIFCLVDTCTS